jgi:hypothetical protein
MLLARQQSGSEFNHRESTEDMEVKKETLIFLRVLRVKTSSPNCHQKVKDAATDDSPLSPLGSPMI